METDGKDRVGSSWTIKGGTRDDQTEWVGGCGMLWCIGVQRFVSKTQRGSFLTYHHRIA